VSLETEILERRVGQTLRGKWTLERLLGCGGMAAVYVARHKIGRRDAIKILHPEIAENKDLTARFEQEAHAVNRFRHPGAVSILDIDTTEDGAPFLVMELLEGESLEARRLRGPIDPLEALRLTDELLDVLAAAHASDIIHRDIKPDNLFVLPDGRLKVLDFGIARMHEGKSRTMHTALGVTIGTLAYMSPEQVAGDPIDARADLFAVGCTMFEMASGRLPHEGATEIELMVKMGMMPAPPLASVAPGADPGLCLVVDRALAFEREHRYPDAATMQADVRALRAGGAPRYASAKLAEGDLPNPAENTGLRAPLTSTAAVSIPRETSYRTSLGGAPPSAVEVAAVAVPTQAIRGNDRRDRMIAAVAVTATLLLCLAVVGWRVMRSSGDEPTTDAASIAQPAASAAPAPSILTTEDDPLPSDTALAEGSEPAAQNAPTPPALTPERAAPAAPVSPAPPGIRPAIPLLPKNLLPKFPVGVSRGKKPKKR
jgi:serine/threonine-protein kinase